jgi:hypothetical protein
VKRCLVVLEKPALELADGGTERRCDTRPAKSCEPVGQAQERKIAAQREMTELDVNVEGETQADDACRKTIVWILRLNGSAGPLPALVYTEDVGWDFFLMREPTPSKRGRIPEHQTHAKCRVAFGVFEVSDDVFRSIGCELIVIRNAP